MSRMGEENKRTAGIYFLSMKKPSEIRSSNYLGQQRHRIKPRNNETSFKKNMGTHFWMPIEDYLLDQFVHLPRLHYL
jgi:hypothetical protein